MDISRKIFSAIRNRDIKQLKLLCESGENILEIKSILNTTSNGIPPLYSAITDAFFCDEIVSYLIQKGANPNARSYDGYFLLHSAINHGHLKGAQALISNGANVNIKNKNNTGDYPKNEAALHFAIAKGAYCVSLMEHEKYKQILELVRLLIEKKADVNAKNEHGNTPLHNAALFNAPEIAKLLIKNGADVNIKNNTGQSPLDKARKGKNKQELITMLENGLQSTVSGATQKQAHGKNNYSQLEVQQQPTDATGGAQQQEISRTQEIPKEDVAHNSAQLEVQPQPTDNTKHNPLNLSLRKWAIIGIATVTCALALALTLYFLPLVLGTSVGLSTKLALGAAGAVIGGGVGYFFANVAINKFYGNEVTLNTHIRCEA